MKSNSKKKSDLRFYCIMMALPIIQFCIMWLGSNTNSILLAFKEYDANLNATYTLANFIEVFQRIASDKVVQSAFANSAIFYLCSQVLTIPISLAISYYFHRKWRFSRGLKTLLFLPSVVASVATVTSFYIIADRLYPALYNLITGESAMGLIANNETQFAVFLFYNVFFSLAGGFIFFSGAMGGVDTSLQEAARIDGASTFQEFIHVILPMIYPTLSVWIVSGTVNYFVSDFSMYAFFKTSGATELNTLGYYFISGITSYGEQRYPFYAAFGLVLTAMACIVTFSLRALLNTRDPFRDEEGGKKRGKGKNK